MTSAPQQPSQQPLSIFAFGDLLEFLHTHGDGATWNVSFQAATPIQRLQDILVPSVHDPPTAVTWTAQARRLELNLLERSVNLRTDSISFLERCHHLLQGRGILSFQIDLLTR